MSIDKTFPKILILGETFRVNGGGGITLINLFKGWDPKNLAVVTERIYETSFEVGCKKFYRLGDLELKMPFPFNHINKIQPSGEVKVLEQEKNQTLTKQKQKKKQIIKFRVEKAYYKLLLITGIYHFLNKITLSEQLLDWINEYSPDIIYAQPFRFSDMLFIAELQQKTSIPMAVHIMDDSISFLNKPNLLYYYWRKKTKSVFRQLIDSSIVLMSISQLMSDEYYKRYKRKFIPIRNPIELSKWVPFIKQTWRISDTVNIIYTGRLAIPNVNTLFQFCKVVDHLNKTGQNITFDIFSIDDNKRFKRNIENLFGVYVHNPIPYEEIPQLIPQYDIALLPIDFNKKGIRYAKYSISTKTSEYMISGVPILLIAPKEVALSIYAIEKKCMLCVNEDNHDQISAALVKLIEDKSLRESLAHKAIAVAETDSDAKKVRQEFKFLLDLKTNI